MEARRVVNIAAAIIFIAAATVAIVVLIDHRRHADEPSQTTTEHHAAGGDVDRAIADGVARLRDTPELEVTAGEMLKLCENAVACDQQYKNRTIRMTGKLRRIEIADRYRLVRIEPSDGSFNDVVCVSVDDDSVLGALRPGDRVFVRGIGKGLNNLDPVLAPCLVEH